MASFPYFNGTGSVYVCIRKLTDLRTQTHTEPVPLKYGKLATKSVDIRIFSTVYKRCVKVKRDLCILVESGIVVGQFSDGRRSFRAGGGNKRKRRGSYTNTARRHNKCRSLWSADCSQSTESVEYELQPSELAQGRRLSQCILVLDLTHTVIYAIDARHLGDDVPDRSVSVTVTMRHLYCTPYRRHNTDSPRLITVSFQLVTK